MLRCLQVLIPSLVFFAVVISPPAMAKPSEKRLALVIGNASYRSNKLATTISDAALVAETLRAAGFDVTGARDLDQNLLRQAFRNFVDAVAKAGPDAVAAVYFAGYGVQLEGENYLLPVDANIAEIEDLPRSAVRLSEQLHALGELHLKATFVILDMARKGAPSGQLLAGGLAWVEPESNMLIALNASPGTVSTDGGDGYGDYAKALAEMILEGSRTPSSVFDRVRLRVNELTKGAQVPWDNSRIETQFSFLERNPEAPMREDSSQRAAAMRSQSMRSLGGNDAYWAALARDTFDGYGDFLADFWREPMMKQIQALLAIRREAFTWRRTYQTNAPSAYWSYLERYPHGPHVADARRLLANLGAPVVPPSHFVRMEYDVPPPLPDELQYIERAVLDFDDPSLGFNQPQKPPVYFLEQPPEFLNSLSLPLIPSEAHVLPASPFTTLPRYLHLPADVLIPPGSTMFDDARNLWVVNVPTVALIKPDEQEAPSISLRGPTDLDDRPYVPPSVAGGAVQIESRTNPLSVSENAEQVVRPPTPLAEPPLPSTPFWAALDPVAGATPLLGEARSVMPFTPSWAADYGTKFDADAGLAPIATNLPPALRKRRIASPLTTGSIPMPIPRQVTFAAQTNRNRPKPIANSPSTSSSIAVGQAAVVPPRSSGRIPVIHLPRPPKAALGTLPPQPNKSGVSP